MNAVQRYTAVLGRSPFIASSSSNESGAAALGFLPISGGLFTPQGIDEKRLRRWTQAQRLLNVVPISRPELNFARQAGVAALVERFQTARVRPMFDDRRRSAV